MWGGEFTTMNAKRPRGKKSEPSATETTSKLRFERQPIQFQEVKSPSVVKHLEIAFCDLGSLDGIDCLSSLEEIHVSYCRHLHDISAIDQLKHLRKINLYSLPNVRVHFSPAEPEQLVDLAYNNVRDLPTIRGIERLRHLVDLGLSRVTVLDGDYEPIIKCMSLQRVFWHGGPFKSPALREIRHQRPDLLIGGNSVVNLDAR